MPPDGVHHRPHALDARFAGPLLDDAAAVHGVVDDDQRARPRQRGRVLEVRRALLPVCIDEDEVERWHTHGPQRLERMGRRTHHDLHGRSATSTINVLPGEPCAFRIEFERDERTARDQPPGEPDRAEARERADLKDAPRSDREGKHLEQSALCGRDGDPGKTGALGRHLRRQQGIILWRQPLLERPVDGVPCRLLRVDGVHAGSIPDRGSPRLAC